MTVSFILEKLKHQTTASCGSPGDGDGPVDVEALATSGAPTELRLGAVALQPVGMALPRGARVEVRWTGRLFCTCCGSSTPKLFSGFCWACWNTKAMADACVMAPQKCHYLSGTCREPAWGQGFCYQPHAVYLSYTSGIKVGITRTNQIPVRWIDQGATRARLLCLVGSRHQAGVIEEILAQHFSDKTLWSRMLSVGNSQPNGDEWAQALNQVHRLQDPLGALDPLSTRVSAPPSRPGAGRVRWLPKASDVLLSYLDCPPVAQPKTQVMEKGKVIGGQLLGVKGQYLIFTEGVFNVRRHEGYEVEASVV
jgi:hypothetical protein